MLADPRGEALGPRFASQWLRLQDLDKVHPDVRLEPDFAERLISAMRRSEDKMQPVLAALKDNVLYLKHNLNAQAVASLKTEFSRIEQDIDVLIEEMRKAIASSDEFIESLQR